jgi:hypothetical protein
MLERTRNVMVRLTEEEFRRLEEARRASDAWRPLPMAAWVRRTLLNLYPAKPKKTAAPKRRRAA